MDITLSPITAENYTEVFALKLSAGQEALVTPPLQSLAMAYVYYSQCLPLGICRDGKMVGYAMVIYDRDALSYELCHLMIDASEQRKGIGRQALRALIAFAEQMPLGEANCITAACAEENAVMIRLNRKAGFRENGRRDESHVAFILPMNGERSLSDGALTFVTGGSGIENDGGKEISAGGIRSPIKRTGDTRRRLTERQRTPEYIRRQIFGRRFDEISED